MILLLQITAAGAQQNKFPLLVWFTDKNLNILTV